MAVDITIRRARAEDAATTADLAEEKRAEYAAYSPIFWRPAHDARVRHLPFLSACFAAEDAYAAFAAEEDGAIAGVILANRHGAPPPFRSEPIPTWFVDDFYVADPDRWLSAGAALLAAVAEAARAAGAARVVVVGAARDLPKRGFLLGAGYALAAVWWVRPLEAISTDEPAPDLAEIEALLAPAPPVYDPGGPVALAVDLGSATNPAAQLACFEGWAAAQGAALAIVPAHVADAPLAEALATQGYAIASEWYARAL